MTGLIILLVILIIFALPIFLFIKHVSKKTIKQKESAWTGKLIDKEHVEYEDDDSAYTKDLYTLYFNTVAGKKVKINVSKEEFEKWEKGEKAEKTAGSSLPQKVK
jgi:hypothetical protein